MWNCDSRANGTPVRCVLHQPTTPHLRPSHKRGAVELNYFLNLCKTVVRRATPRLSAVSSTIRSLRVSDRATSEEPLCSLNFSIFMKLYFTVVTNAGTSYKGLWHWWNMYNSLSHTESYTHLVRKFSSLLLIFFFYLFCITCLLMVQLRSRIRGLFQKFLVPLGATHFRFCLGLQQFAAVIWLRNSTLFCFITWNNFSLLKWGVRFIFFLSHLLYFLCCKNQSFCSKFTKNIIYLSWSCHLAFSS